MIKYKLKNVEFGINMNKKVSILLLLLFLPMETNKTNYIRLFYCVFSIQTVHKDIVINALIDSELYLNRRKMFERVASDIDSKTISSNLLARHRFCYTFYSRQRDGEFSYAVTRVRHSTGLSRSEYRTVATRVE